MKHILTLLLCALPLAAPLSAQDRAGNDTPGEWVVDHTRHFGLWDSLCDHRITGEMREERCYIRYVDVFSGRPNFGAIFLFVTPGPEVEIGLEPGTIVASGGIRIERDGAVAWDDIRVSCRVGLACDFAGDRAQTLVDAMQGGGVFAFDFRDRHGKTQALRWNLDRFPEAHADYLAERAKRGL